MSLNQIELNTSLLTTLYKDVLVETGSTLTIPEQQASLSGKIEKETDILVLHSSQPDLKENELLFLGVVLAACKLEANDAVILNINGMQSEVAENSIKELEPKTVLLFDVKPVSAGLPMHFPYFQIQNFNQKTYLSSPSLSDIQNDKKLKSELWRCLKLLFGI